MSLGLTGRGYVGKKYVHIVLVYKHLQASRAGIRHVTRSSDTGTIAVCGGPRSRANDPGSAVRGERSNYSSDHMVDNPWALTEF